MRKIVLTLVLIALLSLGLASTAIAAGSPPVGGCPPGYVLHTAMEHEMHGHHIGLTVDLNGDGYICVKHLDAYHVHIDNVIQ